MTIRFVGVGGIYTPVLGANMSQLKGAGNSWKIRVHPPHWNPFRTSHHWFLIPLPLEKIWEVPKPMEKYLPSIDVQWQETTPLVSRRFRVAEFARHFKKVCKRWWSMTGNDSIYLSWLDLKSLTAGHGSQPRFPSRIITSTTADTPMSSPVRSMKYSSGARKFTRVLNLTELVPWELTTENTEKEKKHGFLGLNAGPRVPGFAIQIWGSPWKKPSAHDWVQADTNESNNARCWAARDGETPCSIGNHP